jgi:hypothetical protein
MCAHGQTWTTKKPLSYDEGGFLDILGTSTAVFWCREPESNRHAVSSAGF